MKELKSHIFIVFLLIFSTIPASHAGIITPDLESVLQSLGPQEEVSVIINLSDEVDLNLIKEERDKHLKRAKIVAELKDKANSTQGPLRALLQARSSKRIIPFWIMNGIAATVPAWTIRGISNFPGVEKVALDFVIEAPPVTLAAAAPPEWNISAIKAPDLWDVGFTGAGVVVANTDTGVDILHPDLNSKWRGGTNSWFNPYSDPSNAGQCRIPNNCSPCELSSSAPCDVNGHGTGTMGVMVGDSAGGTAIGVAPDATWIAVKVLNDARSGASSIILQGFQWILDLPPAEAPDVVNNSWGLPNPNGCNLTFQASIQALKAAGISVAFAAGNDGPSPSSSISPANNVGSFAAGATDINNTIAVDSSRGPTPFAVECGNGAIFPHVVAPGVDIKVAAPTNGGVSPTAYVHQSGTSFAAPHVAGTMALLLSAFPSLTPTDLESTLEQTALDLGTPGPDNNYGYGLVDSAGAYRTVFNTIHGTVPQIAAFPSSFGFGNSAAGTASLAYTFSIVNQGTADLLIDPTPNGVTLTGQNPADFVITGDTCSDQTIGPLSGCSVTAAFSPTSIGHKSAAFSIQSNDATVPVLNLSLSGTGIGSVGVFRPSLGEFLLRNTNTTGPADIAVTLGKPGDWPVAGDWTGKGYKSVGIFRSAAGKFFLRNTNTTGPADITVIFGQPGDIAVAGDWTRKGYDSIGVFRPSTGQFLLRNTNTTGPADIAVTLGKPGDWPVAGDWTGKGYDSVGIHRPATGKFFLRNTNTTGPADITLVMGKPGDMPVAGDWTGKGYDSIGIFRPATGKFFLRNTNTTGPADITVIFGQPGDMPVTR